MQEITVKIKSKNPDYNGMTAGIEFKQGQAEISLTELKESVKEYLINNDYELIDFEKAEIAYKKEKGKKWLLNY